jgi:hypothetical protein
MACPRNRVKSNLKQTDPIDLPRLLGLGGERRGEEAARQTADERPPVHYSTT